MTEHDILTDDEREALREVMQTPDSAQDCVLIVEDDELSRDLMVELLELHGIQSVAASNEGEALALLKSNKAIGLILTDLRMEPYDGLHLIRKVRHSELAALPVIIMSGHAGVRDAIDAMHLSVVDFLLKPIDVEKLLQLIRQELHLEP
ncbi:MAG: response regulator [Pseudomonadota bacterium]